MKYELMPRNRGLTSEELLEDLQRVAQVMGKKSVSFGEYRRHGRCGSETLRLRFGSWNKALSAAGLEVRYPRKISNQELFENLERVWQALGRQPWQSDMVKPLSAFTSTPYENRFGGWRKALEVFVAWANSPRESAEALQAGAAAPKKQGRFAGVRLRYAVFKRDSFRCQACGRSPATDAGTELHVDHKVPWSLGGKTSLENLCTLCEKCNQGKRDGE